MAFAQPSLQHDYTLCSEFDPALDLPELPELGPDPSDADREARDKIAADRAAKVKVAQARGTWADITKPGERPTYFKFRQIHGTALTWLQGTTARQQLSDDESLELVLRLALLSVDNFGGPQEFKLEYEQIDKQRLVTKKSIEPIYSIGRDAGQAMLGRKIVLELGSAIWVRTVRGIPPLS